MRKSFDRNTSYPFVTVYFTERIERIQPRAVAQAISKFDAEVEMERLSLEHNLDVKVTNSYAQNWCYFMHDALHMQFSSETIEFETEEQAAAFVQALRDLGFDRW